MSCIVVFPVVTCADGKAGPRAPAAASRRLRHLPGLMISLQRHFAAACKQVLH
jgi:hypothetical protein